MRTTRKIIALSLICLSIFTFTAQASTLNVKGNISNSNENSTINEMENVFEKYCEESSITLKKYSPEYEVYLRNFLINEDYGTTDIETIKLIRAYAAIYLNQDFLKESIKKEALTKNGKSIKKDFKEITIKDVKTITEKENNQPPAINARGAYGQYRPALAESFARDHVYNPPSSLYTDFTNSGGDCTNFVSNALYWGGINKIAGSQYGTNGWFYYSSTNRSATWTGANQFGAFWRARVSTISGRNKPDIIPSARKGDVIQYKEGQTGLRYHSIFVCVNYSNDLTIAQRTSNYIGSWSGRGSIPDHGGYETYFDLIRFSTLV